MHGHGNILVRDEPVASILQEALEGFASLRFETQGEVKRFLETQPAYPKDCKDGTIRFQRVTDLLSRPVYAGVVEAPKWNVSRRKGHHEPLISIETYERIQERLHGRARAPDTKRTGLDFPLRGFVRCGDCGEPLTGCWSTSSSGKTYPYYLCYNRDCPSCRKSIPRDQVESAFDQVVAGLQPSERGAAIARSMFREAWDQRVVQAQAVQAQFKSMLGDIAKQVDQMLARVVAADTPAVIRVYETKIAELETQKLVLTEKLDKQGKPQRTFEELFELALWFLSNPWKLWSSGQFHLQRIVLRLAFLEGAVYCRKSGFSNIKTAMPFKFLENVDAMTDELARPTV